MDTIQCRHCGKHSVPHLWHYSPFLGQIRYMKTQHICRFCGVAMYETGGGISTMAWIAFIFCTTVFGSMVLAIRFQNADIMAFGLAALLAALYFAFCAFVLYKIVRYFKSRK